ncbi:MAG: hypothetical protein SGI72_05460 [Planctomycetota bacterium]|nr:hypothetical protein [Planctomycetota bacterium]
MNESGAPNARARIHHDALHTTAVTVTSSGNFNRLRVAYSSLCANPSEKP